MTQQFNFIEENQASSGALIDLPKSEYGEGIQNSTRALIPPEKPEGKTALQDLT